jgi:hypothetical protein
MIDANMLRVIGEALSLTTSELRRTPAAGARLALVLSRMPDGTVCSRTGRQDLVAPWQCDVVELGCVQPFASGIGATPEEALADLAGNVVLIATEGVHARRAALDDAAKVAARAADVLGPVADAVRR